MADLSPPDDPYGRLVALGISLPRPPIPVGNFVPAVLAGNLLFLSGQGSIAPDGSRKTGKVGSTISVEEAYQHARMTTLNLLAVMHDILGSLCRIVRIAKVLGMVNAAPDFAEHPRVINGCSDLLIEVFGETVGRHARSAVGMGSLPGQITVEIELIAIVRD